MYKDPTEFRQRFDIYKKTGKSPYKNGRPEPILRIDSSESDFAQRLRSPWRQEIWDWEGSGKAATHKMSSADNIVYPNVQTTKGGGLIDFTHPMWKGVVDPLERAIRNKDYVPMKTEDDAIWTGPNYKKYYPGFKYGKESLPKFRLGTEGELNMGERKLLTLQLLSEVSKSTIHEQPVSNTDPVGEFIVNSVGATKGARIIGDILTKARLGRMANTYRLIRKFDSDKQQYTGKSLRKENIRFADKMARESFTLSRPENPLYWIMDPIVAGYSKLLSHPIIGPLIPF